MDYIIEYGEYRAGVTNQIVDSNSSAEINCFGQPFTMIYDSINNVCIRIADYFTNIVEQIREAEARETESASPELKDAIDEPIASDDFHLFDDMPDVTIESSKDLYQSLIEYLQGKIVGMELTSAEQVISKVNPEIKLLTSLNSAATNTINIYVNIDEKGVITSIDNDAKIIAEFYVE